MKRLDWIRGSYKRLKAFPIEARKKAGHELMRVQEGLEPEDWKPIKVVGQGAMEIRIHVPFEHRVIYVAKFPEAIYVLNAFSKKTQATPLKEIQIARKAYAEVQKNLP